MKKGLLGGSLRVVHQEQPRGGPFSCCTLVWVLSRKRLDFHLLDEHGETVEIGAAPPDSDGLRGLADRLARHRQPLRAAVESMTGARFVHDQLELAGWEVEIADAAKVKGLAPLACKTDRIDAWVLAELSRRELVPAIWLPDPAVRAERERARFRLHLVRHRSNDGLHHSLGAPLFTEGDGLGHEDVVFTDVAPKRERLSDTGTPRSSDESGANRPSPTLRLRLRVKAERAPTRVHAAR